MNSSTTRGLVDAVRVSDLRAYLLSTGWQIRNFKRPNVLLFEKAANGQGTPLTQLIPASERLDDYPLRIPEILKSLSVIEGRPEAEVLQSILTPTSDILHLGVESPETRTGALELGFVEPFFRNVRNLVVFAACGEIRPQPFYSRALKQGVQLADRCRFRPAPPASFRVDVEAPLVPPVNEAQVQLKAYPLERLVLLGLMHSLGELQQAIEAGQPGRVLNSTGSRISANLCDAILGMKPGSSDVRWQAFVSWSPSWPLDESPPEVAWFEGRAFEQLASISRALRSGNEPGRRILRGRVVRLAAEDPVHGDLGPLVVTLDVETANAPGRVEVVLSPEQYRQACLAHLEGRRIALRGVLDRVGRRWQFLQVADFVVLNETSLERQA